MEEREWRGIARTIERKEVVVKLALTLINYLSPLLRHLPQYYFDIKTVLLAEYHNDAGASSAR
jgi:hypothetical protein